MNPVLIALRMDTPRIVFSAIRYGSYSRTTTSSKFLSLNFLQANSLLRQIKKWS
jgi:hypothetical protein